jgi:anthranilate phosphoribosyltransferase
MIDPSQDIRPFLAKVAAGETLSEEEAYKAFFLIMSGNATEAQIGAFLMGLRLRGECEDEIVAAVRIMRENMRPLQAPEGAIDIVGTGGDGSGTYNISTATALVVAGAGVPVAKHGNKAMSSKSGAADVLSCLGVNVEAPLEVVEKAAKAGLCFMMAPRHHPAMRHVGAARSEIGVRTVFNLLGPLANPAGVKRQFTGVYDRRWIEPVARVLGTLGCEKAWVVHGSDGLDELTTTGPSHVAELKEDGSVTCFDVSPDQAGLPCVRPEDLKGGLPEENAAALRSVLDGAPGAYRDIVLFNAAAALIVAGKVDDLADGALVACRSIDEGKAKAALDKLVSITGEPK